MASGKAPTAMARLLSLQSLLFQVSWFNSVLKYWVDDNATVSVNPNSKLETGSRF